MSCHPDSCIYLSVPGLGLSALACPGRSYSGLILLSLPGVTRVRVIAGGRLSVVANGTASRAGCALRECARREHYACRHDQNFHGHLLMWSAQNRRAGREHDEMAGDFSQLTARRKRACLLNCLLQTATLHQVRNGARVPDDPEHATAKTTARAAPRPLHPVEHEATIAGCGQAAAQGS
jgi:hypothetical protein